LIIDWAHEKATRFKRIKIILSKVYSLQQARINAISYEQVTIYIWPSNSKIIFNIGYSRLNQKRLFK
jgi:hypothetical protein